MLSLTNKSWIYALPDGSRDGYRVCAPNSIQTDDHLCALAINNYGIFNLLYALDDGYVELLPVDQTVAEHYSDVAAIIKHRRIFHGLSQDDLATRLHVTQTAVWYWENGYRVPNKYSIDTIKKILGDFPAKEEQ